MPTQLLTHEDLLIRDLAKIALKTTEFEIIDINEGKFPGLEFLSGLNFLIHFANSYTFFILHKNLNLNWTLYQRIPSEQKTTFLTTLPEQVIATEILEIWRLNTY